MALLVAVLLCGLLAWPGGVSAVTVTVGRQNLSTTPDTNFGCTTTSQCDQIVSPTTLTAPGDRAVVPGDGSITSWRVRGSESGFESAIYLWVLRPSGTQYEFGASSPVAPFDGTPIALSPPLPVAAGDLLGVDTSAYGSGASASAAVLAVSAVGAGYNLFSGVHNEGDLASPSSTCSSSASCPHAEPLFNATVVLDRPVVSSVSPGSGSTAGGETVTIRGNHLAGASQLRFGGLAARSFSVASNTKVTAVTPRSLAGGVDVTVKTLGGTSATSGADQFTFVLGAGGGGGVGGGAGSSTIPPAKASFAGSKSSISVSRKHKFKFGFHAVPGLGGNAVFTSVKRGPGQPQEGVTLARKSFKVPVSGKVTLQIKLLRKAFRILKLNGKIRTRATITLKNAAGLTSQASKKITLKAPKRHR